MVMHDPEWAFWDRVLVNNTKLSCLLALILSVFWPHSIIKSKYFFLYRDYLFITVQIAQVVQPIWIALAGQLGPSWQHKEIQAQTSAQRVFHAEDLLSE